MDNIITTTILLSCDIKAFVLSVVVANAPSVHEMSLLSLQTSTVVCYELEDVKCSTLSIREYSMAVCTLCMYMWMVPVHYVALL